jgi:hypothetical protein
MKNLEKSMEHPLAAGKPRSAAAMAENRVLEIDAPAALRGEGTRTTGGRKR